MQLNEPGSGAKQIGVAVLTLAVLVPFSLKISDIYVDPSDPGFGARDFPRLIAVTGIGLALLLLGRVILTWIKGELRLFAEMRGMAAQLSGPLVVGLAASLYVWAIVLFQYVLPTLAIMIFLIRYFGGRGVVKTVVVPVLAVSFCYLLFFVLLGVFEEPGRLLSYDTYALARDLRQLLGLQ